MATSITFNGVLYSVPSYGDGGYAQGPGNLSLYLIALSTGTLQNSGGMFTLTADVNFGPNFGLISKYYISTTTNPATAGQVRLAKTDTIDWRNNANNGNIALGIDGSDNLTFNGFPLTGGFVTSITGTANQIIASSPTGNVTLSTPQDIAPASTVTFGQIIDSGLTANRVVTSNGSKQLTSSTTTDTELGFVSGVTSSIQTQLNGKQASGSYALTDLSNVSGVSTDVSLNNHKLTNVNDGTAPKDAANFGQIKYIQAIQNVTTTSTTTTSTTFVPTALSAMITPSSSANRIKITITTTGAGPGNDLIVYTIFRGGSGIGPSSNGFTQSQVAVSTTSIPHTMSYIDSPATTSTTTYSLQFKSQAGGSVTDNPVLTSAVMILEEIV